MATIAEIEAELLELNKIKPIVPTASQLHQKRYALVNRVQRRENERYWQGIQSRKVALNQQLLDLKSRPPIAQPVSPTELGPAPVRRLTRVETRKRLKSNR